MTKGVNRGEVSDIVLAVVKRWLEAYARIYQLPRAWSQIRVSINKFHSCPVTKSLSNITEIHIYTHSLDDIDRLFFTETPCKQNS